MKRKFKEISFFKKLLVSYIIIILLPSFSISTIYLYNYNDVIKRDIESNNISKINNTSLNIDNIIGDVKTTLIQTSIEPRINNVLATHISDNIYNYSVVYEDYKNMISYNNLFYAGYIYSAIDNRVIDANGGVYDLDSFFDNGIIYEILNKAKGLQYYGLRTLKNSMYNPVTAEVMTFACDIPVTSKNSLGKIIINVNKTEFFRKLNIIDPNTQSDFIVLNNNNDVILSNAGSFESLIKGYFKENEINDIKNMTEINLNNKKYFVIYKNDNFDRWTLVKLVPFQAYKDKIQSQIFILLKLNFIIFFVSVIIAYGFSLIMYKPLKSLLKKLSLRFSISNAKKDEYLTVNSILNELIMENDKIKQSFNENELVIKERLISSILNNKIDEIVITNMLEDKGISFNDRYFIVMVVIVSFDEDALKERYTDLEFIMYSYVKSVFGKYFHVESTIIDNEKFGFIINTKNNELDNELRNSLIGYSNEVNSLLQQDIEINTQFIFGNVYDSIGDLHISYKKIRKIMNYKFIINKKDIIFLDDIKLDNELQFPVEINYKLIQSITNLKNELSLDIIEKLFKKYTNADNYADETIQEMVVMLISSINSELLKQGLKINIYDEYKLVNVINCKGISELKLLMNNYVNYVIELLKQNSNNDNIYIKKAKEFMKENYERDISISDVAGFVGLSSGYLSNVFNLGVKKSIIEYLTEYRMEEGKKLLENREYSIKKISSLIGYNDPHSFIRYFKKKEGITPSDYRKTVLKNS